MCAGGIYRGKSGIISTWRYFTKDTASDNINCTAVCYAWLCNNTGDISGRTDYEYACSSAERAYYSVFYLFPAHRSNPPYHSSSSAETLLVLISLWRTAPSRSFITWSAMFLMASLCVTMIMVFPYFLLTSSMSFKISFEVL